MAADDVTEQVARCCNRIVEAMHREQVTKYVAVHALGAALCQALGQIESEEVARGVFGEMLDVVTQTMSFTKELRGSAAKASETAH